MQTQSKKLTLQEIFDISIPQWRARNYSMAVDGLGACAYRSPEGPCLVGMILPDEFVVEGTNVPGLFNRFGSKPDFPISEENLYAVSYFQSIHDDSTAKVKYQIEYEIEKWCEEYGVTYSEPQVEV